jgi:hypothetical protein
MQSAGICYLYGSFNNYGEVFSSILQSHRVLIFSFRRWAHGVKVTVWHKVFTSAFIHDIVVVSTSKFLWWAVLVCRETLWWMTNFVFVSWSGSWRWYSLKTWHACKVVIALFLEGCLPAIILPCIPLNKWPFVRDSITCLQCGSILFGQYWNQNCAGC